MTDKDKEVITVVVAGALLFAGSAISFWIFWEIVGYTLDLADYIAQHI